MDKNYIPIKDSEKKLYRIFKELEKYGRSSYSKEKSHGINRKIGLRVKPFVDKGLMIPPLSSKYNNITGVQLPINIGIKERKTEKGIHFYFYRKK